MTTLKICTPGGHFAPKKLLPLILALSLLAGCAPKPTAMELNPPGVVAALMESTAFSEQLEPLDKDVFCPLYGLDPDTLVEGAVYASTGATAEEFAVFVLKDKASADAAYDLVSARLTDQTEANRDYRPLDVPKLEAAHYYHGANSICLVIANDASAAEKAMQGADCYRLPA